MFFAPETGPSLEDAKKIRVVLGGSGFQNSSKKKGQVSLRSGVVPEPGADHTTCLSFNQTGAFARVTVIHGRMGSMIIFLPPKLAEY